MAGKSEIVFWVMKYKDGGLTLPVDAHGARVLFYHAFPEADRKRFKAVPVRVTELRKKGKRK